MLRILRHYHSVSALILFLVESLAVALVVCAAYGYLASSALDGSIAGNKIPGLISEAFVVILIMYSVGLYDRAHRSDLGQVMRRLAICLLISIPFVVLASEYIVGLNFKNPSERSLFYLVVTVGLVTSVLASRLVYRVLGRVGPAPHRVLVVGVGASASEIERLSSDRRYSDGVVVGYYSLSGESPRVSQSKILAPTTSLMDTLRATGAKELVVALDDRRGAPLRPLLDARMAGITVTSYLSYWEQETRRLKLANLEPSWLIYSDGFRLSSLANVALKRLLDIGASLGLLIITLPISAAAALAILFEDRGPILYSQDRVGRHGRNFRIYKYRTMRVDAEGGAPQWASTHDPRVTRVGSFLRLSRIDEIPQLYNVLRGDMTLVGPRPERPFFVDQLTRDIPYYSERHRVRPGITGWAQINYPYGASIEDAKEKLSYDLYYIKNFSILFDFLIVLATVQTVLWNKGAR